MVTVFSLISAPIPQPLHNFKVLRPFKLVGQLHGGAYFKVRGIVHINFQNLLIFSFQMTTNNNH